MKRRTKQEEPGIGHNSDDATEEGTTVAAQQLRSIIERHENLLEDRKAVNQDISELMAEAKGVGFDTKTIKTIVRLRAMDQAKRLEEEAMVDLYKNSLGME